MTTPAYNVPLSLDNVADVIIRFYEGALVRPPSDAELAYYIGLAESGVPAGQSLWNQIATDFVNSAEFAEIIAGTDVVATLFQNVLGRPAGAGDLAYYHAQLASGVSTATLLQELVNSPEDVARLQPGLDAVWTIRDSETSAFGPAFVNPDVGRPHYIPLPLAPTIVLTTGIDQLFGASTGNTQVYAVLNGSAPTLNSGDSILCSGSGNLMQIDAPSGTAVVLPAGVTIGGVQTLVLNAGGNAGGTTSSAFDVSGFAGLAALTVTSSGSGVDNLVAGSKTNVVDTAFAGAVDITGGLNVTVITGSHADISVQGASGVVTARDDLPMSFIFHPDMISVTAHYNLSIKTANGVDMIVTGDGAVVQVGTTTADISVGAGSSVTVGANSASIDRIAVGGNSSVTFDTLSGTAHHLVDVTAAQAGNLPPSGIDYIIPPTVSQICAITTINNAVDDGAAGTQLLLDNVANHSFNAAAVNLGSTAGAIAFSRAAALDLAASQAGVIAAHSAVLEWFQWGGNTYLVDAVNASDSAAAHTQLTSTDVVVQLSGLVNIGAHGAFTGGTFTV